MPLEIPPRAGRGEVLHAFRLNAAENELRRIANLSGGPGVVVRQGRGGIQVGGAAPNTRHLARAEGTISPRVGDQAGTGKARVWMFDPLAGDLVDSGVTVDVLNASSTRSAVDEAYVWVELDPFGAWHLIGGQSASFVGRIVDHGAFPNVVDRWIVVNPVAVSGAETEGSPPTKTVDAATDVYVSWVGPILPAVGRDVVVVSDGKTWHSSTRSHPTNCAACPAWTPRNLAIAYTNPLLGEGSALMTYKGSCKWETGCFNGLKAFLDMSGATPVLAIRKYSGGCPTGSYTECRSDGTAPNRLAATTVSCSPFALSYQAYKSTPPTATYCSALAADGYLTFTVTE